MYIDLCSRSIYINDPLGVYAWDGVVGGGGLGVVKRTKEPPWLERRGPLSSLFHSRTGTPSQKPNSLSEKGVIGSQLPGDFCLFIYFCWN